MIMKVQAQECFILKLLYFLVTDEDRDEFFDKFATLQAQANLFLKMLNDMRRRLKELPQNSVATQQYRYRLQVKVAPFTSSALEM